MSIADYTNSAFSSEDEDENEVSDHSTDVDVYASFFTDYEKYQSDRSRWNGIPNSRTHTIAKKKAKGKEGEGQQKTGTKKAIKSARNTKLETEAMPEALPKVSRKGKNKKEEPREDAVQLFKEGVIHFDSRGALWYSHRPDNVYLSERATFHHWIRPDLSQTENAEGTYDFPRKRGVGDYDITCFNKVQEHWGLERAHYAPIMFEWQRMNRANPTYKLDSLYYQGLLVLDYWHKPIRNFHEIPLVISSVFEGGYMEPATRLHGEMGYEDIRARMPPFVEIRKNGEVEFKALYKASALSGRSRHFREEAGAISWDGREGSANIKLFIEGIVMPFNNSTRWSRDLTKDEVKKLRLMNCGTKPLRAKSGTTKESKEKYIADTRRAAGVTGAPVSLHEAEDNSDYKKELEAGDDELIEAEEFNNQVPAGDGWMMEYLHDNDSLFNDHDDCIVHDPIPSIEDTNQPEDESMEALMEDATSPRFVFCCTEAPFVQAMTERKALTHPLVNMSDPRNRIPKFSAEIVAIRDALQVTIDHFKEIFDFEPQEHEGANYISEYCNIQDQMDDMYGDDATALRRLGRWEGTIFDWQQADVHDDPCVGRKQPFGSASHPPAWFDFCG